MSLTDWGCLVIMCQLHASSTMCHQQGGIVKLTTALYYQWCVICDVIRVLPGMVAGIS